MTIQSALIFNSNGGYNYLLRASGRRILSDRVNANGVIINSGASFTLLATVKGTVQVGTSTTVLNNTGASPISGTFANGAFLTVGSNKFQANYEGGDGNDLTPYTFPLIYRALQRAWYPSCSPVATVSDRRARIA